MRQTFARERGAEFAHEQSTPPLRPNPFEVRTRSGNIAAEQTLCMPPEQTDASPQLARIDGAATSQRRAHLRKAGRGRSDWVRFRFWRRLVSSRSRAQAWTLEMPRCSKSRNCAAT